MRNQRVNNLRYRYGLEPAEYAALFEEQDGMCQICGELRGPLHVDHCHVTKRVRGLLCQRCNTAVGMLRDSPRLARRAASYLRRCNRKPDPCAPEPDAEEFLDR